MSSTRRKIKDELSHFIVILEDVLFDTMVGLLDKDRGLTIAKKLEAKIRRKTGNSMVLSFMESQSKTWSRRFKPAPRPNMIYVRHPFDDERYLGAKQFHDILMIQKREELFKILIALGAKSIEWQEMDTWTRHYEAPEGLTPELNSDLESECVFLYQSPQWKHLIQERLMTWCSHGAITFIYEDDYGLNDSIIDIILQKIDAHPECLNEYDSDHPFVKKGYVKTNSSRLLKLNAKYKSFRPIRDNVKIEFFTKEEYHNANILRIRKTWTVDHVEAYLRHILLERLVPMFRVNYMTGVMLLKIPDEDAASIMKRFYMSSRELELMCASLQDIGDVDNADFMKKIEDDTPQIIEAHKKRKPGELEEVVTRYEEKTKEELRIVQEEMKMEKEKRNEEKKIKEEEEKARKEEEDRENERLEKVKLEKIRLMEISIKKEAEEKARLESEAKEEEAKKIRLIEEEKIALNLKLEQEREAAAREADLKLKELQERGRHMGLGMTYHNTFPSTATSTTTTTTNESLSPIAGVGEASTGRYGDPVAMSLNSVHTLNSVGNTMTMNSTNMVNTPDYMRNSMNSQQLNKLMNMNNNIDYNYLNGSINSNVMGLTIDTGNSSTNNSNMSHSHDNGYSMNGNGYSMNGNGYSMNSMIGHNFGNSTSSMPLSSSSIAVQRLYSTCHDQPGIEGTFRLTIIGQEHCGKTSLFKAFCGVPIDYYESSTIGRDSLHHHVANVSVLYDDVGGISITNSNVVEQSNIADCIIFLYDVTSIESFEWLAEIVPDVILTEHSTWTAIALVGTKLDLVEPTAEGNPPLVPRAVWPDMAVEFAESLGVPLCFEVSSLHGNHIIDCFAELLQHAEEMRVSAPSQAIHHKQNMQMKLTKEMNEIRHDCCKIGPMRVTSVIGGTCIDDCIIEPFGWRVASIGGFFSSIIDNVKKAFIPS